MRQHLITVPAKPVFDRSFTQLSNMLSAMKTKMNDLGLDMKDTNFKLEVFITDEPSFIIMENENANQ